MSVSPHLFLSSFVAVDRRKRFFLITGRNYWSNFVFLFFVHVFLSSLSTIIIIIIVIRLGGSYCDFAFCFCFCFCLDKMGRKSTLLYHHCHRHHPGKEGGSFFLKTCVCGFRVIGVGRKPLQKLCFLNNSVERSSLLQTDRQPRGFFSKIFFWEPKCINNLPISLWCFICLYSCLRLDQCLYSMSFLPRENGWRLPTSSSNISNYPGTQERKPINLPIPWFHSRPALIQ